VSRRNSEPLREFHRLKLVRESTSPNWKKVGAACLPTSHGRIVMCLPCQLFGCNQFSVGSIGRHGLAWNGARLRRPERLLARSPSQRHRDGSRRARPRTNYIVKSLATAHCSQQWRRVRQRDFENRPKHQWLT